jgi:tetratricopeptide (TPR) repeat protein
MEKNFQKILSVVLYSLIFLFPFFFLPFTQEYFVTNKLYLLGFGVLLLLSLSIVNLLLFKKITWQKNSFDNLVLLFLSAITISIVFSSTNKIQALLNPSFGLTMMIALSFLYFYLSRTKVAHELSLQILSMSSVLISIVTTIFYFQPFKNVNLPPLLAFLKNPSFTPLGSQLDLVIFLGFFVVYGLIRVLKAQQVNANNTNKEFSPSIVFNLSSIIFLLVALFLTAYSLLKAGTLILPPLRLSWFAVLEILKIPSSALIGIGLDNFSSVFTRVKDLAYNQSPLWQVSTFNVSRSAILQILTETGILGLFTFGWLIFNVFRKIFVETVKDNQDQKILFVCLLVYLLICLFIFPTSFVIWFLFFVLIAELSRTYNPPSIVNKQTIDLSDLLPIYLGTAVVSFFLIAISGYFLGRSYASEYYFKKSFDGVTANNIGQVYDSQRQAIILNPYIEKFRSNFAQTNLLIANNLAQKDPKKMTEEDRQTITQAIQASIAEGKAVVSLNPQKADGWQNLASIYLNVINAAQGADVWTISAYQRAILSDPQNPTYRVGLGGVYYSLKKYDDALRFFEQAISLKPDWPNASYNYAWANFQKANYPQAVNAMQNTLSLLNMKLNKADYEKVQKELAEFKKLLPKDEKEATKSSETVPGTLNLPTPPATQISPKLELPKEASPEAK